MTEYEAERLKFIYSELTESQAKVVDSILTDIGYMLNGDIVLSDRMISLTGSAGVGKTFATKYIVQSLIANDLSVRLTAPTHKAVRVLKDNIKGIQKRIFARPLVTYSTIHSFLKLKLKPNLDMGVQELVADTFNADNGKCDILIVDESSMVSETLFEYIQAGLKQGKMKVVLFIGDSIQLKPIDTNKSNAQIYDNIYENFTYELTEIVRQAKDNPIIKEATFFRDCIKNKRYKKLPYVLQEASDNIILFDDHKEFVNHYLASEEEDKIVCSYTNKSVDGYNLNLRRIIKGDVPYIMKDDILIFQDTFSKGEMIIYNNNDDIVVEKAELLLHPCGAEYWRITPKLQDDDDKAVEFNVIDVNSFLIWERHLESLKQIALTSSKEDRRRAWAYYFEIFNSVAYVRHHYATTIHKLQGSTFKDVYFDFRGLYNFVEVDVDTVYRLIYVAITRASNRVIILK